MSLAKNAETNRCPMTGIRNAVWVTKERTMKIWVLDAGMLGGLHRGE
jgi:hypothetical protein